MLEQNVRELIHREHYQELLREADNARLIRQAFSQHEGNRSIWYRMMKWLSERLAARQQRLPRYSASDGSVSPLPAANQPQQIEPNA